jgi:regulator of sigma E protease
VTGDFGFLIVIAVVILVHILGILLVRRLGVRSRAAMAIAGLIANLLLAVVVFAGMFAFVGEGVIAPRIDDLLPDGPAARAGFKVGDVVVSIDGSKIASFGDLTRAVSTSAERELTFEVKRGDTSVLLNAKPERREMSDSFGNKVAVGVLGIRRNATYQPEYKRYSPMDAAALGIKETYSAIAGTAAYLRRLIIGGEATVLTGPVSIVDVSGERARLAGLLKLAGGLSVHLGLILGLVQLGFGLLMAPFKRAPP